MNFCSVLSTAKRWKYRTCKFLALVAFTSVLVHQVFKLSSTSPKPLTLLTEDVFQLISPSSYKYLLNQAQLCQERRPFLVLMIPVKMEDKESRNAIRKTWGHEGLVQNVDIVRLFFIGDLKYSEPKVQEELVKESSEYGDIIQMNFLDSYYNLTIKTMMMMNWLTNYCPSAQYAMKVDTDVFLNLPFLVRYLQNLPEASKHDFITGSVITDGRPRRNKMSKWYLSKEVYSEDTFPVYISGPGYVFSVDLAIKISQASRYVRPIPLEDVYVGLCLQVLGVWPQFSSMFFLFRNQFDMRRLKYERCTFAKRIMVTGFKSCELLNIWHDFQKASFSC